MRWVLSIFSFGRPLRWKEIPELLLKAAVYGAMTGPFFAAFFGLLESPERAMRVVQSFGNLFWAMVGGIVFAESFYILCGLGSGYLRTVLMGYPESIRKPLFVTYNALASSTACVIAILIVSSLPPNPGKVPTALLWRLMLIEGIIGAVLSLVIGAFMRLKREVERTEGLLREKAEQAARAQSLALQSQINPHFFFNTLNTISALTDDDPAAARRMIGSLADLFRYTLGCTTAQTVTLDEEMQFVRDYLAIEQARFRRRLRVDLPDGPLPKIRVPGLVLQPLVENAVKHGIAPLIEGGAVSVCVADSLRGTRVSVRNTAGDVELPDERGMFRQGHALENVRARLRLLTGEAEPLRYSQGSGWVEFSFEIAG